ncbi:hypothetical protein DPMN_054556 [Dreissena polymorpha]|uniref:Uncharacterized protein n=1 Tax=Dreissena polymorpha TaxID=45954 RepID=A0A9D4CNB9_DREPO|nr:hypothetical protein DPMN_054556 [Dreissena polymorpha]
MSLPGGGGFLFKFSVVGLECSDGVYLAAFHEIFFSIFIIVLGRYNGVDFIEVCHLQCQLTYQDHQRRVVIIIIIIVIITMISTPIVTIIAITLV